MRTLALLGLCTVLGTHCLAQLTPVVVADESFVGRALEVTLTPALQPYPGAFYWTCYAQEGALLTLLGAEGQPQLLLKLVPQGKQLTLVVMALRSDKQSCVLLPRGSDLTKPLLSLGVPRDRWVHLGLAWSQRGTTKQLTVYCGANKETLTWPDQPNELEPKQIAWLRKGTRITNIQNSGPVALRTYP